MNRRDWLFGCSALLASGACGCRGYQFGHVVKPDAPNLVGSHKAGSEVYDPLVDEAVAKLLARQQVVTQDTPIGPDGNPLPKTVFFVGVENKSSEDIGDFKDQLYQQIDSQLLRSPSFRPITRRMLDAALFETRLRPDSLYIPDNMRLLMSVLERDGAPVDYLLYAVLTSGTTTRNSSTQRDHTLTLELVNVHSGVSDKESAEVRKGYHKTAMGSVWNYNPFKR